MLATITVLIAISQEEIPPLLHGPTSEASLGEHVGSSIKPTSARSERHNHMIWSE
jgi:hypothetical protein